jgi:hypothetical protein
MERRVRIWEFISSAAAEGSALDVIRALVDFLPNDRGGGSEDGAFPARADEGAVAMETAFPPPKTASFSLNCAFLATGQNLVRHPQSLLLGGKGRRHGAESSVRETPGVFCETQGVSSQA